MWNEIASRTCRMYLASKLRVFMPASIGSMQSHRRAWWWGRRKNKANWLMICEEDIEPIANAREKVRYIFQHLQKHRGRHHMVMLAGADNPLMSKKAREYSNPVAESIRLVELRSLPMDKSGVHWVPKHVGLGIKWYLLLPECRDMLLECKWAFHSFERRIGQ